MALIVPCSFSIGLSHIIEFQTAYSHKYHAFLLASFNSQFSRAFQNPVSFRNWNAVDQDP
jgi:hypothetical protein